MKNNVRVNDKRGKDGGEREWREMTHEKEEGREQDPVYEDNQMSKSTLNSIIQYKKFPDSLKSNNLLLLYLWSSICVE